MEKAGLFDCFCSYSHHSMASPSLCLCQSSRMAFL